MEACDLYFEHQAPPADLEQWRNVLQSFVQVHTSTDRPVVLVTSGGTTVPLEHNMVRFLDNFSAGTRGSASVEYFLENNYAVVFLHRRYSLEPFSRHYSHAVDCFLDFLDPDVDNSGKDIVRVRTNHSKGLKNILEKYHNAINNKLLVKIPFVTVTEYLWLLRMCAQELSQLRDRVIFYLAAAVSDFYIPDEEMAVHKIQSGDGGLTLQMQQVPKMMRPLVKQWCPDSFVVSFKLETDEHLLVPKSRKALSTYGHRLVIGNLLNTRKYHVKFVTPNTDEDLVLTDEQKNNNTEIESIIVSRLAEMHREFMKSQK